MITQILPWRWSRYCLKICKGRLDLVILRSQKLKHWKNYTILEQFHRICTSKMECGTRCTLCNLSMGRLKSSLNMDTRINLKSMIAVLLDGRFLSLCYWSNMSRKNSLKRFTIITFTNGLARVIWSSKLMSTLATSLLITWEIHHLQSRVEQFFRLLLWYRFCHSGFFIDWQNVSVSVCAVGRKTINRSKTEWNTKWLIDTLAFS